MHDVMIGEQLFFILKQCLVIFIINQIFFSFFLYKIEKCFVQAFYSDFIFVVLERLPIKFDLILK